MGMNYSTRKPSSRPEERNLEYREHHLRALTSIFANIFANLYRRLASITASISYICEHSWIFDHAHPDILNTYSYSLPRHFMAGRPHTSKPPTRSSARNILKFLAVKRFNYTKSNTISRPLLSWP